MHVCTIVAGNYLPMARVLAASLLRVHPEARFSVLVTDGDRVAAPRSEAEPFEVLTPGALDLDAVELHRMAMAYDVTELATALKPWLLSLLLDRGAQTVTYLDPDTCVYAPLDRVAELAAGHAVVLTPHLLTPLERDGLQPSEAEIMAAGAFNLGFITVGHEARPFLAWWRERLSRDAISDQSRSLFTDQRWVDLVPSLFPHVVLRDPGCNVAYWNVHDRPVARAADGWTAGGVPLRFFHFSGYRPHTPWLLSRHATVRPRVLLSDHPGLAALCDDYGQALRDNGADDLHGDDYGWGTLADGQVITSSLRRLYRQALLDADRGLAAYPPDPFAADGPRAYLDWLHAPVSPTTRVTRFVQAAWAVRPDLQGVFPDPTGRNEDHLLAWLEEEGSAQLGIPVDRRPSPQRRFPLPPPAADGVVGVNVLGYLKAELGVGQIGRVAVEASRAAGLAVTPLSYDRTVNRQQHPFEVVAGDALHAVNVIAVNADQLATLVGDFGPDLVAGRPTIGVWAWEVEEFPSWLHEAFDLVDEVWALSSWSAQALATVSPVPVHVLPGPVVAPSAAVRSRAELGLPDGTVFLFAYDHMSVLDRKNPEGVIEAFRRAFAPGEATLVLKSVNGHRFPVDRERLHHLVGDRADIVLRDGFEPIEDLHALMASVDCYVSLHRAEGYGLTMAEAMALGTPVVATAYSGNLDFMTPGTAMLVPWVRVPVPPSAAPYPTTSSWAEPDLDAAARFLRSVHDDPAAAAALGERGRADVLSRFPLSVTADFVRQRVLAHQRPAVVEAPVVPVRAGDALRPLLRGRPPLDAPAARPLVAKALRRGVNRVLRHHDLHAAGLLERVVTLVEELDSRRHRELDAVAVQLAELQERVLLEGSLREDLSRDLVEARTGLDGRVTVIEDQAVRASSLLAQVSSSVVGGAVAVPCDVGLLHLPARDSVIAPWLREYGSWEPAETAVLRALLRPGDAFLDVGAHVGYHVLSAARLVGAEGHVLAVEPSPEVLGLLRHNLAVNLPPALQDVVDVLPVAAWDGVARLSVELSPDGNSGATRVRADATGAVEAAVLGEHPDVLARPWRLVMTDVEGNDARALRGLLPVLQRDRPYVLTEFNPDYVAALGDDPHALLEEYRSWGYDVNALGTGLPVNADPGEVLRAAKESEPGFVTLLLRPR